MSKNEKLLIIIAVISGIVIALALTLGLFYGLKRKNNNDSVTWYDSNQIFGMYPGAEPMVNQMGPMLISPFSNTNGVWTVEENQVVVAPYSSGSTSQLWYFYSAGGPWGNNYPAYIGTDLGNVIVTTGDSSSSPLTVAPVTTSNIGSVANPAIVDNGARTSGTSDCDGYLFFNGSSQTNTSSTQFYLLPVEDDEGSVVNFVASPSQPLECNSFSQVYFGLFPTTQVIAIN